MAEQLYRALLTYVLAGVVIVAGLAYCAGRSSAKDDAAVHAAAESSAQWLTTIRKTRWRADSIERARIPLQRSAARSSGRAIAIGRTVIVDTTPAPRRDTVAMSWVSRTTDTTRYAVPLFFVEAYEVIKVAWLDERRLRLYDSTYTIPLKDTLNLQLWQLAKSRTLELDLWKRKARHDRWRAYAVGAAAGVATYALLRR